MRRRLSGGDGIFSERVGLSPDRLLQDGGGCAYDKESLAIIKLNNTTVLYLKEVTKFLALVCILREESFERKGQNSGRPSSTF